MRAARAAATAGCAAACRAFAYPEAAKDRTSRAKSAAHESTQHQMWTQSSTSPSLVAGACPRVSGELQRWGWGRARIWGMVPRIARSPFAMSPVAWAGKKTWPGSYNSGSVSCNIWAWLDRVRSTKSGSLDPGSTMFRPKQPGVSDSAPPGQTQGPSHDADEGASAGGASNTELHIISASPKQVTPAAHYFGLAKESDLVSSHGGGVVKRGSRPDRRACCVCPLGGGTALVFAATLPPALFPSPGL